MIPLLHEQESPDGTGLVLDTRDHGGLILWVLLDAMGGPVASGASGSIHKATAAMIEAGRVRGWWAADAGRSG